MTVPQSSSQYNVYQNVVTSATPNPLIQNPDSIDEAFVQDANQVLQNAAEVARVLLNAHQSAIAIIVEGDWSSVRKYFSLSEKYAAWVDYKAPATGYGIHNWILQQKTPIRLTQAELEAHPEWKNFGKELSHHPPMRGWLAAPLLDKQGKNWGLFQLSDKVEGEFTEADEAHFVMLTRLVSQTLEALWEVRDLRKAQAE